MKIAADLNKTPGEYEFPKNDQWGFAGEIRRLFKITDESGARIWLHACLVAEDALAGAERVFVRNFLRSGFGRHLADDLTRLLPKHEPDETEFFDALNRTHWHDWQKCFNSVVRDTREGLWDSENTGW